MQCCRFQAYYRQGVALQCLGRHADALGAFAFALAQDDKSPQLLTSLTEAAMKSPLRGKDKWLFVIPVKVLIMHMKKLLDSDWLRQVQSKCNTGAKSVTPVQITHRNIMGDKLLPNFGAKFQR